MTNNAPTPDPFDAIKDDIGFTGFTDKQGQEMLDWLREAYQTETGREMIDGAMDRTGLHYFNSNDQAVAQSIVRRDGGTIEDAVQSNYAYRSSGDIYLDSFPSRDNMTDAINTYTVAGALNGQPADRQDTIRSLDKDGEVFEISDRYVLLHETGHVGFNARDITAKDYEGGKYFDGRTVFSSSTVDDYKGINETRTQEVMKEIAEVRGEPEPQLRGSYVGTAGLDGLNLGDELGLGQEHDLSITTIPSVRGVDASGNRIVSSKLDMTSGRFDPTPHSPLSVVVKDMDFDSDIILGNLSDTAHGFDGDDTMNLGGGNDRGYGGLGDDIFTAGRGLDYYDGGEANLDPASNHQSDNTTNWGIDSIDYRTLDIGGGAAGMLSAKHSFDGVARDGIQINIEGRDGTVLKGSELGSTGEQADYYHNIDIIHGTSRDDLTEVKSLDGLMYIDGSSGHDTLNISNFPQGTVTHVPGAGTFNGQSFEGYVQLGTAQLFYNDYENIILPPVNASDGRPRSFYATA